MKNGTELTESQEQIIFVEWMRLQYPEHRVIAIPNGGMRNVITATRLKKEGVSKGVPDIFIPSLQMWIEFKRKKGGRATPEQREWMIYLEYCNYDCNLCHGADEAMDVIKNVISHRRYRK